MELDWSDIESAPKDGTEFLVCVEAEDTPDRWIDFGHYHNEKSPLYDREGREINWMNHKAKLWMPMPQMPEVQNKVDIVYNVAYLVSEHRRLHL